MSLIFDRTHRVKIVLGRVQEDLTNKRLEVAERNHRLVTFSLAKKKVDLAFERNVLTAIKNKTVPHDFYQTISTKISNALGEGHEQGLVKLSAGFGYAHWRSYQSS